ARRRKEPRCSRLRSIRLCNRAHPARFCSFSARTGKRERQAEEAETGSRQTHQPNWWNVAAQDKRQYTIFGTAPGCSQTRKLTCFQKKLLKTRSFQPPPPSVVPFVPAGGLPAVR